MCRLLGSVSRTPVTIDEVLADRRDDFFALARKHGDGWGHAWSSGADLRVRREAGSALTSPALGALAAGEPAVAAITHLRWATLGLAVGPDNTHPFTDGTVAFAHNGSVKPPAALDALVAPELAGERRGTTDSERYFLALRSRMREEEPGTALIRTVEAVVASGAVVSSLNALLLTPSHLYAVSSHDPAADADPDYFTLLHRRSGDRVVVTSTGWTDSTGWSAVRNGQMLVVDRSTLQTSVVPVATPVPRDVAAAG
ncbi:Predicted glutamine amidotransferase [Friedmanniella luteola]|uniref:Predicted glutamine amidotransferase n=1 Tax=Friedmanniella luteola TaxID=546871 RepID=A0A1H1ZHK6_9ACTN|nr:class II glutamine amidotransferase [Friedmanniella luteola]SDT33123.1 Predicted glutamine amidotransferase [Friedmanniella luteola]